MKRGWADAIHMLLDLRCAVAAMSGTGADYRSRMSDATAHLEAWKPEDFPERLRKRAASVLAWRTQLGISYGTTSIYRFDSLKAWQRVALRDDILALYEACLLDIGRANTKELDFVYPRDREPLQVLPESQR